MENFYLFLMMCIFLIILPGPDTAIATKNTLTVGRTGGFKTVLGTCCALLIHTLAAVVGLSAIIVKSALLFSVFKYVGARVFRVFRHPDTMGTAEQESRNTEVNVESKYEGKSCFRQGFLTNILNPKVVYFF